METNDKTNNDKVDEEIVCEAGSGSLEDYGENACVCRHPLLLHKISILRSSSTIPASFRAVLHEITYHLGTEATKSLSVRKVKLTVPVTKKHVTCWGKTLVENVALIPIMRSGLGMVDSMLELIPKATVHHIGMYKQNQTTVQYYNRLPKKCESDIAYVLDTVLGTSQTLMNVIAILKEWGVKKIHVIVVIASKAGLRKLAETHKDVQVTVGDVDLELDENGYVYPGIGDSGDRLFGTTVIDDEELIHASKRRRTCSES